jgi:hypothetical protein
MFTEFVRSVSVLSTCFYRNERQHFGRMNNSSPLDLLTISRVAFHVHI